MQKVDYNFLSENGLILFETVVGSQAYGTNTPDSDIDKKFVYILPEEYILGTGYVQQIDVNADYTGWEVRRFLELLGTNNPTVLELLNSPEDCVISKHPLFDIIIDNKDKFLTKGCKNSFGGYARQQIKKAKGLDKKQNWEKDRVIRKDVLDFCHIINGATTTPVKVFLEQEGFSQAFAGVANLNNARDVYGLFYDYGADICFNPAREAEERLVSIEQHKEKGWPMGFGYKGLVKEGDLEGAGQSNTLRLSSIPKGQNPIATFSYNKDGYTTHCKDFKEYEEWLKNRNTARYVDNKNHGQKYDSKNMMHCIRLIRMSLEIGAGEGVQIRRSDAPELLAIRRGEVSLDELIIQADEAISGLDEVFENSSLPDKVEEGLVNKMLIEIRKEFYCTQQV
jgi:predicted nucleotidyltransferase|tara:strand:+ start:1886 stop:3070 length:1185 start_codon:yes stop_codon:yes gene_type:complete